MNEGERGPKCSWGHTSGHPHVASGSTPDYCSPVSGTGTGTELLKGAWEILVSNKLWHSDIIDLSFLPVFNFDFCLWRVCLCV